MSSKVTVIMYHYVREIKKSRFSEIKGLEFHLFKEQLNYLRKNYTIIKMEDLLENVHGSARLPENAALLTFDDAYIDHFEYVFPVIQQMGLQGSFYVPAQMIQDNKVLDVNKIHFILALSKEKNKLVQRIFKEINILNSQIPLLTPSEYYETYGKPSRFDTADVMFIKRILQVGIPQHFRSELIDKLFLEVVNMDEESFSKELYMNKGQLLQMASFGMHLGNHTYSHPWLDSLSKSEQKEEIQKCNQFFDSLGLFNKDWTMCFPYGGYNQDTLDVLKELNCKLGLTVHVDIADIRKYGFLEIPRFDTNDLPTY
jgi:peptidoglycan/xylan/chitin deacetylase (PgdA/CDA1 family)